MMQLLVHSKAQDAPWAASIKLSAFLAGVDVSVSVSSRQAAAVKASPFHKLPVLVCGGDTSRPLSRAPAILRHVAGVRSDRLQLLPDDTFARSRVDAWVDLVRMELEMPVAVLSSKVVCPSAVWLAALAKVKRVVGAVAACLTADGADTFLAGATLTIADVATACHLERIMHRMSAPPVPVMQWLRAFRSHTGVVAFRQHATTPSAALPLPPPHRPVIIDTDPGIDDALALCVALAAHRRGDITLVGLTITHGNHNDVDLMARNACFLLEAAGVTSGVPVVKGRSSPVATDYHGHSGIEVHGANGMGNVPLPWEPSTAPLDHTFASAPEFLYETCRRWPKAVTLVTLGPQSNVGEALATYPSFSTLPQSVAMMGGTVDGKGNKAAHAEANVHNDPEASALVLTRFPSVTMVGLNVTLQLEMSPGLRERVRDTCGPMGQFLYRVTQHYVDLLASWGSPRIGLHDPSAVMAVLHPELFTGEYHAVDVEVHGSLTRGCTVVDWLGHWNKPRNTMVTLGVDADGFYAAFFDYLGDFASVHDSRWGAPASA